MRKVWFEDDYEIRLLRRGKRRLLDIVFGRTMVIVVLLLLQVAIMAFGAHYLGRYYPALSGIMHVLAVVLIIYLVNKPGSATTKITWIVLIMALPAFGVLLYLFVQLDVGHRYANRRVQESIVSTVQYVPRQTELMTRLRTELPEVHNLAEYTLRSGDYPVYENTAVTYYPMGQDKIGALLDALQSAEHFIFLEYFIIEEGDVWGRILKILEEKVRAGVEVRVLYDGTCTFYRLPYGYPRRMEALGIRCKMFAPLRPFVSTYYNNRDHRKIAVIDGRVGFTGGVNLADEYANLVSVYGVWKDTAVRLEGEAVRSLTLMFLQMWGMDEREPDTESYGRYLNVPLPPLPEAGAMSCRMPTARSTRSASARVSISTSSATPSAMCASSRRTLSSMRRWSWRSRLRPSAAWMWSSFCRTCRIKSLPLRSPRGTTASCSTPASRSTSTRPASCTRRCSSAMTARPSSARSISTTAACTCTLKMRCISMTARASRTSWPTLTPRAPSRRSSRTATSRASRCTRASLPRCSSW